MKSITRPKQHCLHLFLVFSFSIALPATAQKSKEVTADISKASKKGMLEEAVFNSDGNINVTYGMRIDKKKEDLLYESYVFDKSLNFKGIEPFTLPKNNDVADKNKTIMAVYAGGTTSFNVLSQKLTLQREEWLMKWSNKRQAFLYDKRLSKDIVKTKNNEGKYLGFAKYRSDNGVVAIASYEPDAKGAEDQFVALAIDMDMNIKETALTASGNYSLVYTGELTSGNAFVILAPNKKMPNISEYVYVEISPKADVVKRNVFTAPAPNMMVMDHQDIEGVLYLTCTSTDDKGAYNEVFTNYADISNPAMGISWQDQKYNKIAFKKEMSSFHLLKFSDGKLAFASTTPVKSFKSKVVTPPSQKKSHIYDGKKLSVETFKVLADGSILIAGQLLDKDMVKDVLVTKYLDIVAFLFDAKGELKAQYAVEKMNDDTKSEIWNSKQQFYISSDGTTAYWEILEVKGMKGYDSFLDAYAGNKTYTYGYFPRIAKINLATGALSEFEVLGDKGKFLMYKLNARLIATDGITHYYIGHEDDEKVWIGKYNFD